MYALIIKTEDTVNHLTRKDAEDHFAAVLEYAKEIGVTSMVLTDENGVVLREFSGGPK